MRLLFAAFALALLTISAPAPAETAPGKELLRYVSGAYYKQYDSFSKYNAARRPELLQQGVTIDYAE